jgi:hypothetical protein
MRRITVVFMTKQDNLYMAQIEIPIPDKYPHLPEWEECQIHRLLPNCKDICYVFDGWPNRIKL